MFRSEPKPTITISVIGKGVERCAYLNCSHSPQCTTQNKTCCAFILKRSLLFLDTFFRRHNIPYVVIYGTLLGAVRNGTIIPWTHDVDIGFFNKTYLWRKEIRDELDQYGYHIFEVIEISKTSKQYDILCSSCWSQTIISRLHMSYFFCNRFST